MLAALGQHREATRTFLYAAFTWHQETRQWAKEGLRWLRRERGVLGQEEFTGLVKENRLAGLARDLIAAMDAASPDDADEPGSEDHTPGS